MFEKEISESKSYETSRLWQGSTELFTLIYRYLYVYNLHKAIFLQLLNWFENWQEPAVTLPFESPN